MFYINFFLLLRLTIKFKKAHDSGRCLTFFEVDRVLLLQECNDKSKLVQYIINRLVQSLCKSI